MKVRCEGNVFKTFLWMKNEWICAWKILVRCLGGNFSRKTLKLHIPCLGGREVLPCLVANASEIKVFSNCFTRPWKSSSCCCINLQHIRYAWMHDVSLPLLQRAIHATRSKVNKKWLDFIFSVKVFVSILVQQFWCNSTLIVVVFTNTHLR